ncbi:ribonuclease H-like domain-containing protein [Infundibulicybe gibba]|nr:ribonuclease H-like domain-containing protein [Infundibulicybe gibba]
MAPAFTAKRKTSDAEIDPNTRVMATSDVKRRRLVPAASFADVLREMGKESLDKWTRPSPPIILSDSNVSIDFQQIDTRKWEDRELHLFGVTEEGYTVLARVTGFLAYFYYPSPPGLSDDDLGPLNKLIDYPEAIDHIELVSKKIRANGSPVPFLKIFTQGDSAAEKTRALFSRGGCAYRGLFTEPDCCFEGPIDIIARFMSDCKISAMTWVQAPPQKYEPVSTADKVSTCHIEFFINYADLTPQGAEGIWAKMSPLRILSFDIECHVPVDNKSFSNSCSDPIFQIANMVTRYGEKNPFIRTIFTLDTCDPIDGTQVLSYGTEQELIKNWERFIYEVDPDILIGYNSTRFDLPYILDRATRLEGSACLKLERYKDMITEIMYYPRQREWHEAAVLGGRVQIDVFKHIMEHHPAPRKAAGVYKLGAVSKRFLGEDKVDIAFTDINRIQEDSSSTRRDLAVYCCKDAFLPQKLFDELACFSTLTELVRELHIPLNALLEKPKMVSLAKTLGEARRAGLLCRDSCLSRS